MAINFQTGGVQSHPAYSGPIETAVRTSGWATTSDSWADVPDLSGGNITIMNSGSVIVVVCHLSTEVDQAAGHGIARIQKSVDDGSYSTVANFNVTGSPDNSIGNGFQFRVDHDESAGTTIKFKVQYRKNNTTGNHTIADTGPGEATRACLFYWEQQE
tara:strand:+ start:33 stop:506 length:474 start_codon:yes stop_codon:yes gene_type:complete